MSHRLLTGANLHKSFNYIQETDPGAVGADQTWLQLSSRVISIRNESNTGWYSILASSSVNALPVGTTWTQFVTAYDNTDPGDTIELPNDEIIQEDDLWIGGKAIRIRGSGPNSKLTLVTPGVTTQFFTGWADTVNKPIYLENFTFKNDRTAMGPTARAIAIRVYGGTYGLHCTNLTFQDITSDCYMFQGNTVADAEAHSLENVETNRPIEGVYIYGGTVTEWYESVFNIHNINGTHIKDIYFENYNCTVSAAHPNGSISRPYCTNIDIEEQDVDGGLVENVHIHGNSFTSSMTGADYTSSLGLSIKRHGVHPNLLYTKIYVTGNLYDNWYSPCQVVQIREGTTLTQPALIYIIGNTFKWDGGIGVRIEPATPTGTEEFDYIFVGDNDIYSANDHYFEDLAFAPDINVVQLPPNRTFVP